MTTTDMGSGRCPSWHPVADWFSRVAYVRNIWQFDTNGNWNSIQQYGQVLESKPTDQLANPNPYGQNSSWGGHIYFGGPGEGIDCY